MTTETVPTCRWVPVPPLRKLTWDQRQGRACYACGKLLTSGAIPGGRATGTVGERVISAPVWACP